MEQKDKKDKKDSSYADGQEIQDTDFKAETKEFSVDFKPESLNDIGQNFHQNEQDKKNYEEILEKLDIVKKGNNQDIQQGNAKGKLKKEELVQKIQNLERIQAKTKLEADLKQDFAKVQKLVSAGIINSEQGQNLKKQVLKKAFDRLVQTEKVKRGQMSSEQEQQPQNQIFNEFSKSNQDFFNSQGRKEVLNYLKSGNVNLGQDEFSKISDLIRMVEKAAIDRYLQKAAHEKTLMDSNETAKQRLTANAQKSGSSSNFPRAFTREQIGKMSTSEFVKYENAIMEALKKGQIK